MDIFNEWKKIEENNFNKQSNKEEIMKAIFNESKSTISVLKKRLLYKIRYIIAFLVMFSAGLVYFQDKMEIVWIILLWIISYAIGGVLLYRKYKQMNSDNGGDSLLDYMKQNAHLLKSALQLEKAWGLTFFPIAIISGYALGALANGSSLIELFADNRLLIKMLVTIVIVTPLMNYLTGKMNANAYGAHIKELDEKILMMEKAV